MEVRINKEIREYTESMFFGLTLRQFCFSVLACGTAILLYFTLRPYLGLETLSWLCIIGAAPFGAIGFIKYHGMSAEKFLWAWIKSEILLPKKMGFSAVNIYEEAMKSKYRPKKESAEREKKYDKDA